MRRTAATTRSLLIALLLSLPALPATAEEFTLTVDVPSDLGGTSYLANQTVLRASGAYSLVFDGPGNGMGPEININALLLLENGDMLFSTDTPFSSRGTTYLPRDIVRESGGSYSLEQAGDLLGLPDAADVDALSRDAQGNLLVSFTEPESVAGTTFQPDDIAKIEAGALSLFLSGDVIRLPDHANVVGYEWEPDGDSYFMFDTPVTIGATTYLPGDVVRHDGVGFSSFFSDPAFPAWSAGWGFALPGSPGEVVDLRLDKNGAQVDLAWNAGCSQQQNDYAVYEGTLGAWSSHDVVQCATGGATGATVAPDNGDRYFLIVPQNGAYEGSYGTDSWAAERGPGVAACQTTQKLHECL